MTPRICMRNNNERGIAMITTLLVLMLISALLVGFTTVVMSDQRYRFIDRDRGRAFYAASAGVEKLTADLGNLFLAFVAPTAAQVTALTAAARMPVIPGITFAAVQAASALPASQLTNYHCRQDPQTLVLKTVVPAGTDGYTVTYCQSNLTGNPTISDDPLVVTGTGDLLVPPHHSSELAELIPGARLVLREGATHGLNFEDADWFNQLVLEFLDENPLPGA